MKDLFHDVEPVAVLDNANITSNTTTNATTNVDMAAAQALLFLILIGNHSGGTFTPVVEEAPDNNGSPGAWSEVDDEYLLGTEAGAALDGAGVAKIGYVGSKRFVRVNLVSTGGGDADASVVGIKGALYTNARTEQTP